MKLALVEEVFGAGTPEEEMRWKVCNAETGEPIEGIMGYRVVTTPQQRVMEVSCQFIHGRKEHAVQSATEMPPGNGRIQMP